MIWKDEYSEDLVKIMKKLKKRDNKQHSILRKKMDEILENPLHYKNLRYDLSDKRRPEKKKLFNRPYNVWVFIMILNKSLF